MARIRYPEYPSRQEEIAREINKPNPLQQGIGIANSIIPKLIIEKNINELPNSFPHPGYPDKHSEIEAKINNPSKVNTYPENDSSHLNFGKVPKSKIVIVDYDSDDLELVELQWIPKTISYKPQNKLVALASVGRNNPFYHYGGSEDSLEFTIDWFFTNDLSREKALKNARWVESLSKTNGYESGLHRIKLIWGTSGIYANDLWLIAEAPYELSNWVDNGLEMVKANSKYLKIKQFGLLPQSVTQDILLKRVTQFNLKHSNIREVKADFNSVNLF